MSSFDFVNVCRLCLTKDGSFQPIFGGENEHISLKITSCLPVKVTREDKLPQKICDQCCYKLDMCYAFWNQTVETEKQLLQWLSNVDTQNYAVTTILNQDIMKGGQSNENRLDGSVMQQVSGHQNSMNMGIDNMCISMIMPNNNQQQITSVPIDTSGSSVQNVQVIAGSSTQTTHDQIMQSQTNAPTQQEEEEESSEDEENSDDECDGDEGLPIKEESEEDPNNSRTIEPTTFVNVSLHCDEAGPSGIRQQKMTDIQEMAQATDVDPKTGAITTDVLVDCATTTHDEAREKSPVTEVKRKKRSSEKSRKRDGLACDACPKRFKSKYLLKRHRLTHTRLELRREPSAKENSAFSDTVPRNQEALSCVTCDFRCNKRSMMIAHLAEKHEGMSTIPTAAIATTTSNANAISTTTSSTANSNKQELTCIVCGVVCARKETLRSHFVRKHTQHYGYSCEHCGKEFKIKGDLTTHTRLNHRESPVICDVCGKTCRNSHSLYTHQKHAHYKAKYECPLCHRRLVTQENLDQHVLTQHERKEKSVCEECGKTFFENYDLRKHMRIHTGDKPYNCTVCGRAFARHSSLSQHLLLHTGERIYACDVCGKSFAQKAGLICHRKIHSGTLPPLPVIHIDHILKEFIKK